MYKALKTFPLEVNGIFLCKRRFDLNPVFHFMLHWWFVFGQHMYVFGKIWISLLFVFVKYSIKSVFDIWCWILLSFVIFHLCYMCFYAVNSREISLFHWYIDLICIYNIRFGALHYLWGFSLWEFLWFHSIINPTRFLYNLNNRKKCLWSEKICQECCCEDTLNLDRFELSNYSFTISNYLTRSMKWCVIFLCICAVRAGRLHCFCVFWKI